MALQAESWGALPDSGGLLDQSAGLMTRLTAARNVYRAFLGERQANSLAEWSTNNPEQSALVIDIRKLQRDEHAD